MEFSPADHHPPPGLFSQLEWRRVSNELPLTRRQSHVLRAVFAGQSDRVIAKELAISLPTVRTHMRALFRVFGVNDRTNLVIETTRIALDRRPERRAERALAAPASPTQQIDDC